LENTRIRTKCRDHCNFPQAGFTGLIPPSKPDSFPSADVTSGAKAGMEDGKTRTHKANYVGFSGYLIGRDKKNKNRDKTAFLKTV
jgi:hypothetical protein